MDGWMDMDWSLRYGHELMERYVQIITNDMVYLFISVDTFDPCTCTILEWTGFDSPLWGYDDAGA